MRYFIISYNHTKGSGVMGSEQETYPNFKEKRDYIATYLNYKAEDIVIINIIELSKEDYESWSK